MNQKKIIFLVKEGNTNLPTFNARTLKHSRVLENSEVLVIASKKKWKIKWPGDVLNLLNVIMEKKIIFHKIIINKPKNVLELILLKLFLNEIIVDINDRMDTKEQLGIFNKIKLRLIFNLADKIIFESPEYFEYLSYKKIISNNKRKIILEDIIENREINYASKKDSVIWIGSQHTSTELLKIKQLLLVLNDKYKIIFLGISNEVMWEMEKIGLKFEYKIDYDLRDISEKCMVSKFGLAPMELRTVNKVRGNLKIKIYMSYGVIPICTKMQMHERLIKEGVNGFFIEYNQNNFQKIADIDAIKSESMSMKCIKSVAFFNEEYAKKVLYEII